MYFFRSAYWIWKKSSSYSIGEVSWKLSYMYRY